MFGQNVSAADRLYRVKSMTASGYFANEAIRSGRIIGEDGDYLIVAIHKEVIARRRQLQRDSLRARRIKARAEYLASIERAAREQDVVVVDGRGLTRG